MNGRPSGTPGGRASSPGLRVWAPRPDRVASVVDGRTIEAEPAGGGWWVADVPEDELAPGTRYGWSLDGGPPRADPRAHVPVAGPP